MQHKNSEDQGATSTSIHASSSFSLVVPDKPVKAPHPIGVEEVACASLVLTPEFQFRPSLAVGALITTARSAGENTAPRHEYRSRPRNAPAIHAGCSCLVLASGDDQFPIVANAAAQMVGSPKPLLEI